MRPEITVETRVKASLEKIWEYWTEPRHITGWYFASEDWCAPKAENDLRVGGTFKTRMEAKDGSAGFDLEGAYTLVEKKRRIEYVLAGEDARKVCIEFVLEGEDYLVREIFEAEDINSLELQQAGWQAILDNFKKYVEAE